MLVVAAMNGDEQAFEDLFKRHQRGIFALALRYTCVREDAEDVVQETFQKAFVHFHKFELKSSFSTWVTRIAINQALMLLRRRRALSEVPIDDPGSSLETRPAAERADAVPDPEATYMQKEKAEMLSAAIRQLRPGMRKAIELRDLGELSNRRTAEHIGVSIGTVKARVFHARRKLAKALRHHMRPRRIWATDILAISGNANRSPKDRMMCNA
jgi:RNA polymerase sigma-70 factor (ECF subfamily)